MTLHVQKANFIDESGRTVMLRGVNLAGSSKVPFTPNGATFIKEGFFDHRNISFVGRPFPLEQADEHLGRLRAWGFNFIRLLITWEAIEHAGPGIYDQAYLEYIAEVVKKAGTYGFYIFIDPHQDVWSRFTGGDGAPGWTLEAAGFDLTHFVETGAAIVHATHPAPYPKMIWSSNASKLACATMFTLFFGGNDFASSTMIDGEPAQEYLQRHYLAAIQQVANRLADQPLVLGYDTMNEPYPGYIGWKNLNSPLGQLTVGDAPSPFQSMLLGNGHSQDVPVYKLGNTGFKIIGTHRMNTIQERAWRDGVECVWKQNGVWDFNSHGVPQLLRPHHFSILDGNPVNFTSDYYRPFVRRFAQAMRKAHPGALTFIETEPDTLITKWDENDPKGIVYAPHWYDGYLVVKKEYNPMIGVDNFKRRLVITPPAIQRSFRNQLSLYKRNAQEELGDVPIVLGEFGIPFDLNRKKAYQTGNYKLQVKAMQRYMYAIEENLLNYTLWVYTPDNNNQHGDLWNDEDFSIFSNDQRKDPRDINSGGRALEAIIRPYPIATAGKLLEAHFIPDRHIFRMKFVHDPQISAPTQVFIPVYHYPHGPRVQVSDGQFEIKSSEQALLYWPGEHKVQEITIKP